MSTTAEAVDIVMCQLQSTIMICAVIGNYAPAYVDYAYYMVPGSPAFDWTKPYHNVITLNMESYATVPTLSTPDKATLTFAASDFDKSFSYTGANLGGVYAQAVWNGSVGLACGNLAPVKFDNGVIDTDSSNFTCYNKELLDTSFLTLAAATGRVGTQCTASQFTMGCVGSGVWGSTGDYTVQNHVAAGWSATDIVTMFSNHCQNGCTDYNGGSAQLCSTDAAYDISDVLATCSITLNARVQAADDFVLLKERLSSALTSQGSWTYTWEQYDSCDEWYYFVISSTQNTQLTFTPIPMTLTVILKNALPLGDRSWLTYEISCDKSGSSTSSDMCSAVASVIGVAGEIYEPASLPAALATSFCAISSYGLSS